MASDDGDDFLRTTQFPGSGRGARFSPGEFPGRQDKTRQDTTLSGSASHRAPSTRTVSWGTQLNFAPEVVHNFNDRRRRQIAARSARLRLADPASSAQSAGRGSRRRVFPVPGAGRREPSTEVTLRGFQLVRRRVARCPTLPCQICIQNLGHCNLLVTSQKIILIITALNESYGMHIPSGPSQDPLHASCRHDLLVFVPRLH